MPPSTQFENRDITHQVVHLIYRLYGSIPKARVLQLKDDYAAALIDFEHRKEINGKCRFDTRAEVELYFQTEYDTPLDRLRNQPDCVPHSVALYGVDDSEQEVITGGSESPRSVTTAKSLPASRCAGTDSCPGRSRTARRCRPICWHPINIKRHSPCPPHRHWSSP